MNRLSQEADMTSKSYEKRNYVFLYRGLSIVRDALLDFVVNRLKNAYGDSWWEKGVESAFRSEDIEILKSQFNKRFSNPAGPSRPGTELYEILDLNYFVNLVENKNNWKNAFAKALNNDRTLLSYVKEIVLFRNPVAHPETGDLRDDDVFRGLDTCERLLRLINNEVADEISKIKNEMRNVWLYDQIGLGRIAPDQVGVSIDIGFQRLEEAIKGKAKEDSVEHSKFTQSKKIILDGIDILRTGNDDPRIKSSNKRAFEFLDRQAQEYLNISFSDACIIFSPLPKFTPEEASRKTLSIRRELEKLERNIKELEIDKSFQNNKLGAADTEFFQNRIDQKLKLLDSRREEYERIRNEVSAPVFFSVTREIEPNIQEEYPFTVTVRVKNLGRSPSRVQYEEGFGEGIKLLNGEINFDEEIEPDNSYEILYSCYCETPGKYLLFTDCLDYAEKLNGWDVLTDTKIVSKAGNSPLLQGERYYQYTPDGIEFIVKLNNVGDKIAHKVRLDETIFIGKEKMNLTLHDDILSEETKLINKVSNILDLQNVILPEVTKVFYSDNNGKEYVLEIKSPFSLLEYSFPTKTKCIGREAELELVDRVFSLAYESSKQDILLFGKKILLIEGGGGVGKSKLVDEVRHIAIQKYGCKVFLEDASNKAPVLRILRQILGLGSDLVTKQEVWDSLHSVVQEDQDIFIQRDVLGRFLASNFEQFDSEELARLKTDILLLLGRLCERKFILLIFENIHEIPNGNELEFYKAILDFAATKSDLKLVICATYRTQENMPFVILGKTGDVACVQIELPPLSRENSERFVNLLIPFPLLNEELIDFVFTWSGGNPLFIREILRQLTISENKYIVRKGNYWFPAPDFNRSQISKELSTLILQRAKRDARDYFQLLQILSVAGLDFSWRLLSCFFAEYQLLKLTDDELLRQLAILEDLGFIRRKSFSSPDGHVSSVNDYDMEFSFEHQLIRDVVYDEMRLSNDVYLSVLHMAIRDQLSATIVNNYYRGKPLFLDPEEHMRQIARHLLHSSIEQQFTNRNYLLNAADNESTRGYFVKAMDYISCFLTSSSTKNNYLEQAQAYFKGARILKKQGQFEKARVYLDSSMSLLKKVKDTKDVRQETHSLRTRILAEQGYIFVSTKDYLRANDYLFRAKNSIEGPVRYRRFFPPKEKAFFFDVVEIYINLAEIWYVKLDTVAVPWSRTPTLTFSWEGSTTYFHRAEALSQQYQRRFGDESLFVSTLVREGEIYSLKEEKDRAILKLQSAIQSMAKKPDESKDKYSLGRALSYLAEIHRDRGERGSARSCYDQARKIQEELQDFYGLGISFGGIGDLFVEEGNYENSEYYLEKAFQYQQMVGDTDRFWRTCFSLSKVNFKSNRYDQADHYWFLARKLVMEKFNDLKSQKKSDVISHIQDLARHYYDAKSWERALPVCLDIKLLATESSQLIRINEMLGKIYSELKDTENALSSFNEELDYTTNDLDRADIYCSLGDICSSSKDPDLKNLADNHYKESVKLFLNNKLSVEAVFTFNKYLQSITTTSDALRVSPVLFDIIELMTSKQMGVNPKLIEQSEKKLEKFKLFKQMGDILVFAVHKMAQNDDGTNLDREIGFLTKAESHYLSCRDVLDVLGGYHKLISVYFRLNLWNKVAECYQSILEIIRKANDIEMFKEAVSEIILLEDKIDLGVYKSVVSKINRVKKSLDLTLYPGLEFDMALKLAKCFFFISRKSGDEQEKLHYYNLSLGHYDLVISDSGDPGLIAVSYHDSAVLLDLSGRRGEAKNRIIEAIKISHDNHNLVGEAHSRIVLAGLFGKMGDFANAQSEYEQSIGILQSINRTWDERVKNQDQTPLSPNEVTHLRFDKRWLANASDSYGTFLLRSNPSEGIEWIQQALELFEQIGNKEAVDNLTQKIEYIRKLPIGQQTRSFIPTSFSDIDSIHPYPDQKSKYVKCASCDYHYQTEKKRCPKCNQKTCPNCGQFVPAQNEFCEYCDTFVG